ncbi:MAG TPA: chitin disaccharide deacetylase [Scandinavium sp.]|jgi:hypothetical protein|uniref:chitin disaccharide deacetylase n=1 Tax=Scandinavium sp. TaxID=2830653 RepID=UPI002E32ADDE|nr:chitin disaccharide deacetylase [Scandinavium sp.]HEX4501342.1 chitin disaccharide deacetylase [Scandinavium sp.]
MTKRLIVNADDFGLCEGVNDGIVQAHRDGVVTSTTAMVTAPAIQHAVGLSAEHPALGVGLHFVLSYGKPLTALSSLVREGVLGKWIWEAAAQGELVDEEIAQELAAQYQRFLSLFGRPPTHIDSHHHVHFIPQVWAQVAKFAWQNDIPLRIPREEGINATSVRGTDGFVRDFYGDNVTEDFFLQALDSSASRHERTLEIMCHPAVVDEVVRQSGYNVERQTERELLTLPALKQAIEQRGYQLATYRDI